MIIALKSKLKSQEKYSATTWKNSRLNDVLHIQHNHNGQDIFSKIARYHTEFEKIHPFGDDNDRTGRLLLNYEL